MEKWTTTEQGFCTEASSLGLRPGEPMYAATLPDGSTGHTWQAHLRGGEVTHWTLTHEGKVYEVYND